MSDDHNHIHSLVTEHESKLVRVEVILERVATNQDRMAEALTSISDSIVKQELLLEKLTHLEEDTKGSIGRVHKRIDSVAVDSKERIDSVNAKVNVMEPIIVMLKNPKMTMLILGALYVIAVEDLRKAVMG